MKKIVVIGANSFQNSLILKAKELGYETHVFAWKCGDVGEKTADYFYPVSITEKEQILQECRRIKPVAVTSIGSDLAVLTVNYVARALGLTANSEKSDLISTNKYAMRKAFLEKGIETPRFVKVADHNDLPDLHEYTYPLIVKPTDRSGSRAITKVFLKEELQCAVKKAIIQSFEKAAIIEEFIEGQEYSCECISYEGRHRLLAITEKFTTGSPHYIEIGHIQPAVISGEKQLEVQKVIFKALDALDIKYGASHAEIKIDEKGNIRIIEIGARMGGDCIGSDLVMLSTGNDFVKMVIDVACGKEPEAKKSREGTFAAIRFVMCRKDTELLERIKGKMHIVRTSDILDKFEAPVEDSSSRYGYLIVTSDNREDLEKILFES